MNAAEAARSIIESNRRGREIVCVLFLRGTRAGERILFDADGVVIGDDAHSPAASVAAARVFAERTPFLDDDVFAELHAPAEQLLIFGAGHIAVPLAEMAAKLGFDVTVLDDRDEFATPARFATGVKVLPLNYQEPLRDVVLADNSYIVLVTRAHKYDFDCLQAVLSNETQPRYIGMIGSKRRVRAAFTALLDAGVARERLQKVHAPVGIDIGAETPAEIAVSIAAELVKTRRSGSGEEMTNSARVVERFFAEPA